MIDIFSSCLVPYVGLRISPLIYIRFELFFFCLRDAPDAGCFLPLFLSNAPPFCPYRSLTALRFKLIWIRDIMVDVTVIAIVLSTLFPLTPHSCGGQSTDFSLRFRQIDAFVPVPSISKRVLTGSSPFAFGGAPARVLSGS